MSDLPDDLCFTASHEWVRRNDDGSVVVGITDHAQEALGDLVFVETPEAGAHFSAGDPCAVVESVKAASDIYSPISGVVNEVNDVLIDTPGLVNDEPYGEGWLFTLEPDDDSEIDALMSAEQYAESLED